jgi:hypothetical protein
LTAPEGVAVVLAVELGPLGTVPVLAVFCAAGEEEQPATANDPTATRAPARHLVFI